MKTKDLFNKELNTLDPLDCVHIHAGRSIETVRVSRASRSRTLYILNNQGLCYSVHSTLEEARDNKYPLESFKTEEALDEYLESFPF